MDIQKKEKAIQEINDDKVGNVHSTRVQPEEGLTALQTSAFAHVGGPGEHVRVTAERVCHTDCSTREPST